MKKIIVLLTLMLAIVSSGYNISAQSINPPEIELMYDDSDWAQPEPGDEIKPGMPSIIVAEFDYRGLDSYYTMKYYAGYLRDALIVEGVSALPYVGPALKYAAAIPLAIARSKFESYWTSWIRDLESGKYRAVRVVYKCDLYKGYKIDSVYGVK